MLKKDLKVILETYGCQMNISDSETIIAIIQTAGYRFTKNIMEASIILINTCSIRENAEKKIFSRLQYFQSFKKKGYKFIIGLLGCMAQRMKETLIKEYYVDLVVGPGSYLMLPTLIELAINGEKTINTNLSYDELYRTIVSLKSQKTNIFRFVPIMSGCNNFCSYCIVPYTRGKEKSRDLKNIINEIQILKKIGCKEITLLGQNVNSFFNKRDSIYFHNLLELIALMVPDIRIRFTTSHPKDMSDKTLEIIAKYDNICKHIHLPVQSGSSKILRAMNRKYTREWYLQLISSIRNIIPEISISTDLLCGFPSETELDHQKTISLMREIKFDSAFTFKYSERPGTYAAKYLSDNIPEIIKIKRLNEIVDLQLRTSLLRNKEHIGKTTEILIEGFSKRSNENLFGRTSQNKLVFFKKNDQQHIGNKIMIKIEKASATALFGKSLI
ncbi:MAG: tRNA (N6-isopentenyl adenosine(37)-C2)-methylthiotransferase MiaB [Bacteroidales bacterium OttesenSCG-928-I14]|jgi:tRNA-2-methylthio-N6-dimethylallyladenosine synthase|nr:tRNA (N6-isopentenyl adenosine(37)-C2)-methylthiotransferase MiaB [Bacteroidales bacterium OttesenSCG-928-I14]